MTTLNTTLNTTLVSLIEAANASINCSNNIIVGYESNSRRVVEQLHAQLQVIAQGVWASYMAIEAYYPSGTFPEYLEERLASVASLEEANEVYSQVREQQLKFANELYPVRLLVHQFRTIEAKIEEIRGTYYDVSGLLPIGREYVKLVEQLVEKLPEYDGQMMNILQEVEYRLS